MSKNKLVYLDKMMGANVTYSEPYNDPDKAAALSEGFRQFIKDHSFPFNIKSKAFVYEQQDIAEQLFYIFSGAMAQTVKTDGTTYITNLLGPGAITINIFDFYFQQPLTHAVQAMSNCVLYAIHHTSVKKLVSDFPEALATLPAFMASIRPQMIERSILLQWSCKDRFKYIVQHHADLMQLVQHKYIAQFLHMSPEQFSRLLRESIKT